MDEQTVVRRRRPAEVQHIVAEFVSSGMGQDEFCRSRGISRSTLYRYLSKRRSPEEPALSTQLVPVELVDVHRTTLSRNPALAVLLENGRKVEVGEGFDTGTLERLLRVVERV
jgi:DNA-binding phage protein